MTLQASDAGLDEKPSQPQLDSSGGHASEACSHPESADSPAAAGACSDHDNKETNLDLDEAMQKKGSHRLEESPSLKKHQQPNDWRTPQGPSDRGFRDLREFWGHRTAVGFAGAASGGVVVPGRLSRTEAEAALVRLTAAAGAVDVDEVRQLRKQIKEMQ